MPRNVSEFNLFASKPRGAGFTIYRGADRVEAALEKGLRLAGASPAHLALHGTVSGNTTRCNWRGVARTAAQREAAIRFWLGLAASDPLPTAAAVESRFTETMDRS